MIILDTCILRGMPLTKATSSTDLLRVVRASGVEKVAVPWLVLEELAAQKAVKYRQKHHALAEAISTFKDSTPWEVGLDLEACDMETLREHWRKKYREIVEVVPTSEEALRQAAFREANALAPCRTIKAAGRDVKIGGRDAAIWLSAIEYARTHRDEKVYFVSSNTSDFGDGESWSYPMGQDLQGLEGRFEYLTSLEAVLNRFATGVGTVPQDEIMLGVSSPEAEARISEVVWARSEAGEWTGFPATVLGADPCLLDAGRWVSRPGAAAVEITGEQAHRIGDEVWATATVSWVLFGYVFPAGGFGAPTTTVCGWDTRLLLRLHRSSKIVLLDAGQPYAIDPAQLHSGFGEERSPQLRAAIRARENWVAAAPYSIGASLVGAHLKTGATAETLLRLLLSTTPPAAPAASPPWFEDSGTDWAPAQSSKWTGFLPAWYQEGPDGDRGPVEGA